MTTMYALPILTAWSTSGGWSNTSGGASNGTSPGAADTAIFDANSGSARSVSAGFTTCLGLTTTNSAPINFTSTFNISDGGTLNLKSGDSFDTLRLSGSGSSTPIIVNANGASISAITDTAGNNSIAFTSNATVLSAMTWGSGSFTLSGSASLVAFSLAFTTGSVTFGSGTISLAIAGTIWTPTSGTFNAGTSTILIADTSATIKTFAGGGKTYYNFHSSGNNVVITGANTFNTVSIAPGASLKFPASTITTLAMLTADGTGNPITLTSSSSGSAATVVKSGVGRINLSYCSIKDISASPANTFYALTSTNVSGNLGITFLKSESKLLQFF